MSAAIGMAAWGLLGAKKTFGVLFPETSAAAEAMMPETSKAIDAALSFTIVSSWPAWFQAGAMAQIGEPSRLGGVTEAIGSGSDQIPAEADAATTPSEVTGSTDGTHVCEYLAAMSDKEIQAKWKLEDSQLTIGEQLGSGASAKVKWCTLKRVIEGREESIDACVKVRQVFENVPFFHHQTFEVQTRDCRFVVRFRRLCSRFQGQVRH